MTSRFDEEATAWDSNRFTVASSKLAFGSLLENLAHVPELRKYRGWDGEGDNGRYCNISPSPSPAPSPP